ncbi:MAG TPA: long-chain-acyl-CoA synthetase [Kofleriaceae bacterium]|nr:long-chain-acyl-CoA synthetase [Kofleriaceae bacterium]
MASIARDLEALLGGRAEALARMRKLARKLPAIARGVRLTIKSDRNEALSIGTYLERNARAWPDRTALLFEDRRYTHRQFDQEANRWAHLLAARGIRKGDAVALFVDNRPELMFAVAGVVKLGAIAAMINSRQHGRALEHSLRVSRAKVFVIGEELWGAFAEIQHALEIPDRDHLLWLVDRREGAAPPEATDAGHELARARTSSPPQVADVRLGDPCFYIYTSGTTGLPKASIMSHFRWIKGAGGFGHAALSLCPDDVLYVALPLYHSNALTVAWSACAATGAAFALRRKFSVTSFWDDVRRYHATSFIYIGELCRYLMNQPPSADDRRHAVRKIVGNGLRPDIWKAFKARFGIDEVYEFYSASEANTAFVNLLNADCTIGLCPTPYALVKYDVDRDEPVRGTDQRLIRVSRGEVGLLISEVTPRYAFDGYTDPAANEKKLLRDVFESGDCWFNSGDLLRDLGFRHAQFVDRVGDTFRWKGENVSTNEVAEVLNSFPAIAESTVYGVQMPNTDGRCGMAAVVLRVPLAELDLEGLTRHLRAELPPYALPLFLRFQDQLEVTGTFKQIKSELRRQGFDPAAVAEPLFVLPPDHATYVPLSPQLYQAIMRGELAF